MFIWPTALAALAILGVILIMILYPRDRFISNRVSVRESRLGGRGIFADRGFEVGDVIEICPTLAAHGDQWGTSTSDYVFSGTEHPDHSVLVLGYGSLYQHSDDPNADHDLSDGDAVMTYTARRRIEKGDEITVDYGQEWWDSRPYTKR